MYMLFIYSDMNFNIIVIVCDIQSSYLVITVFLHAFLFCFWETEFEYRCVSQENSGGSGVQNSFD